MKLKYKDLYNIFKVLSDTVEVKSKVYARFSLTNREIIRETVTDIEKEKSEVLDAEESRKLITAEREIQSKYEKHQLDDTEINAFKQEIDELRNSDEFKDVYQRCKTAIEKFNDTMEQEVSVDLLTISFTNLPEDITGKQYENLKVLISE